MENNRLPFLAYQMLYELDSNGKTCWVTQVREILGETGFYIVWLQQGVGDIKQFLKEFKQRLIDMFIQEWQGTIRDRERYSPYNLFKVIFEREKYLTNVDIYCFRVALSQARFDVLPLNCNTHRYNENENTKCCPFCPNILETVSHLFFDCHMYSDLRAFWIENRQHLPLRNLLSCDVKSQSLQVAKFVFYAIKRRKTLLAT
jgi:hypothetical protein